MANINLDRVGWQDGTLISKAKVEIDGTIYDVEPEQYSGQTPLSSANLKKMEDNTEKAINAMALAILKAENPVGHIRMETTNVNPATYLGFGTWQLWGAGRVPVGVDTSQTEFNTVEKTGGSKYLQKHSHKIVRSKNTFGVGAYPNYQIATDSNNSNYETKESGTGDSGNLQPYITCYMWKRVS